MTTSLLRRLCYGNTMKLYIMREKIGGSKMFKHKVKIAYVLVFMMMFSLMPTIYATNNTDGGMFKDTKNHWAEETIEDFSEKEYVEGFDGKFDTNGEISRAEMVTIINRILEVTVDEVMENAFTDIDESDWFYEEVLKANHLGYVLGFDDGSFQPDKKATRYEVVTILSRVVDAEQEAEELDFTDKSDIPNWAEGSMKKIARLGFLKGYLDGSFKGNNKMTRSELVTVLSRAEKKIKDKGVVFTEEIKRRKAMFAGGGSGGNAKNPEIKKIVRVPKLTSISPATGTLGTEVTLHGEDFSIIDQELKVYFVGEKSGKRKVPFSKNYNGKIDLVLSLNQDDTYKVYVENNGVRSNSISFTSTEEVIVINDDAPEEFVSSMSALNDSVEHEVGVLFAAPKFVAALPTTTQAVFGDVKSAMTALNTELGSLQQDYQDMLDSDTTLDPQSKKMLAMLMSTEAFGQANAQMSSATAILLHSSTSEALDNIETALENIKYTQDVMEWVAVTLKAIIVAAHSGGAISDFLGFGAGVSLHALGEFASSTLEMFVNPILDVLDFLVFLLEAMPSQAVSDSFETLIYSDNYGIDENFGSVKSILGNKRADSVLEYDLIKLMSFSIKMHADINMFIAQDYLEVKLASEEYDVKTDLTLLLNETEKFMEMGIQDLETFYRNKDQYGYYFDMVTKTRKTIDDFMLYAESLAENNPMGASLNVVHGVKDIQRKSINSFDIAVRNLRYTFDKNNDPSIYIPKPLEVATITEAGIIYLNKPVKIKGTMDFTGQTNISYIIDHSTGEVSIENEMMSAVGLDDLVNTGLKDMLADIINKFVDLDINLEDVEVKLKFETSDPTILTGNWDGEAMVLEGHKTGWVDTLIIADLAQVSNGKIKKENASIKRKFFVIAGGKEENLEVGESLDTFGPVIYDILDMEGQSIRHGYMGDFVKITGLGFSLNTSRYQNVYFGGMPIYNPYGLAEFFRKKHYQYFDVEIPDAVSGDVKVIVGPEQNKLADGSELWQSNKIPFVVKPSELVYSHPTAIIGEPWPTFGLGFSHYGVRNLGYFDADEEIPVIEPSSYKGLTQQTDINTLNHNYHKKVNYIVPDNIVDGLFKMIIDEKYETVERPYVAREFTDVFKVNDNQEGIRPSYVINEDTEDGVAVWFDINDENGVQLISAKADMSESKFNEYGIVSSNVGAIPTAPDEASIAYSNGDYGVVWVGKVDNRNNILLSHSTDGVNWSNPINISESIKSSNHPIIKMTDIDDDGDGDMVVVWTENPMTGTENGEVHMATINNVGSNNYVVEEKARISENDASEPSLYIVNKQIAASWSEVIGGTSETLYTKNIRAMYAEFDGYEWTNRQYNYITDKSGLYTNDYVNYGINYVRHYKTASHSDIVLGKNNLTGEDTLYITWEEVKYNGKEDVYFTVLGLEGTSMEAVNISDSDQQSQSPKLAMDIDGTPSLTWIETGYTDNAYTRANGYESTIYFARSFDNGSSFNKPYTKVDTNDNGNRIGHLQIDGSNKALYGLIYQYENNGENEIRFYNTQSIESADNISLNNTNKQNPGRYLLRTISKKNYLPSILIPSLQSNGDVIISNEDGMDLMRLVRNNSVMGNVSASPDGKYISYGEEFLMIAEADGSHPIATYLGETESDILDTFWSLNGGYIAYNGMGELSGSDGLGGGLSYTDKNGYIKGLGGINQDVSYTMWAIVNGDETLIAKDSNRLITPPGLTMYSVANNQKEVYETNYEESFPAISPTGEYYAYVETDNHYDPSQNPSNNGDRQYEYGALTLYNTKTGRETTLSGSAAYPVFSKDGRYIAYNIRGRKIAIKRLDDLENTKIVDNGYRLYKPVFNADSTRLYFNERNAETLSYAVKYYDIASETIRYIGALNGNAGKVDLLTIASEVLVKTNALSLNEGESGTVSVRLLQEPISDVTVSIMPSSLVSINKNSLVFDHTNWNQMQDITVLAIDDNIDLGNNLETLSYSMNSSDTYYGDGSAKPTLISINDNDAVDIIAPTWPIGSVIVPTIINANSMGFDWTDANDNIDVKNYRVILRELPSKQVFTDVIVTESQTSVSGMTIANDYSIDVVAFDAAANASEILTGSALISDTIAPTFGATYTIEPRYLSNKVAQIQWTSAADNVGVTGYLVYLDGTPIGSTDQLQYTVKGLNPNTQYEVGVKAIDAEGNRSTRIDVDFTTKDADIFIQGGGHYIGLYQSDALHPLYNQWSGQSRFAEPTDNGIDFVLEEYTYSQPVIDANENIYTANTSGELTKLDSNGTVLWQKTDSKVIGNLILGENEIYYIDEQLGLKSASLDNGNIIDTYYDANLPIEELVGIDLDGNIIITGRRTVSPNNTDEKIIILNSDMEIIKDIPTGWDIVNPVINKDGFIKYFTGESGAYREYDLYSNDPYLYSDDNYDDWNYSKTNCNMGLLEGFDKDENIYVSFTSKDDGTIDIVAIDTTNHTNTRDFAMDIDLPNKIENINSKVTITDDNHLYITGNSKYYVGAKLFWKGHLICIDLDNQLVKWDASMDHNVSTGKPLVDQDGNIYATNDFGELFKFNTAGVEQWKLSTGPSESTTKTNPIIANNAFYLMNDGLIKLSNDYNSGFEVEEYTVYTEADTDITVTVNRTGNLQGTNYIYYETTENAIYAKALEDVRFTQRDYATTSGYLKFEPNESEMDIVISIHDDTYWEGFEVFDVVISNPIASGDVDFARGNVVIRDDDAENTIRLESISKTANEDDEKVIIQVLRDDNLLDEKCSVGYRTITTSGAGIDGYIEKTGIITFEKGEFSKEIEIALINDDITVENRSFHVELYNPKFNDINNTYKRIKIMIEDFDSISKANFTQTSNIEVEEVALTTQYAITRSKTVGEGTITLVAGGTATYGTDYTSNYDLSKSATITFADGESAKQIEISILSDAEAEENETIILELEAAGKTDMLVGTNDSFEIKILDDDTTKPAAPIANQGRGGTSFVTLYDLITGAAIQVHSSDGAIVASRGAVMYTTTQIGNLSVGTGYYATQIVNGVESLRSNYFEIVNPWASDMTLSHFDMDDIAGVDGVPYDFTTTELPDGKIQIIVNTPQINDRYIFFIQDMSMMAIPFEGAKLAHLHEMGYEVFPNWKEYEYPDTEPITFYLDPFAAIYIYETDGLDYLSNIERYCELVID